MTTQTIPDPVLDKIVAHRPHLALLAQNLHAARVRGIAQQIEKAIATTYLLGETRLTGPETHNLSSCCRGDAYREAIHE